MKLEEIFASNLRKLRTKQGMKQRDVADAIGCSEKAVSKWECSLSIPDIDVLLSLSKLLKTNVEALFTENNDIFLLGIDGGGTKTLIVLADKNGNTVRELRTECSNPIDIGIEQTKIILRKAIYEICGDIPLSSVVCFAGIAGGTSGNMKAVLSEFFKEFGFYHVENDSDNRNIIAAGLGNGDGITLILGTGICSFIQKNGERTFVAGKGYFLDNGGSGYDIGRDALIAYYDEKDGHGEKTEIIPLIDSLGFESPQALLEKIYAGGKKYIASFSRFVYDAAKNGDAIASGIIEKNMERAAEFVCANAKKLSLSKIPLVLAGGLTGEPLTLEYLKKALGSDFDFDVKVLNCEPVIGAVKIAKDLYENTKGE